MDSSQEDAPLATGSLAGSEEALVLPARPQGGSNSRALKVAGLTTLACLLVASQVFTAYMVFNQRGEIHDLKRNSENIKKGLPLASRVASVPMHAPMNTIPLLTLLQTDDGTPPQRLITKVEKTPVVSMEKQVKELLESFQLPQFNETFLPNMESLRQQMEENEWKSLETWMCHWLIFQMAQHIPPAAPIPQSAVLIQTQCQEESAKSTKKLGSYSPQCDKQGRYRPMQCWHSTGLCWCVDENGIPIQGTSVRGEPICSRALHRMIPRTGMTLMKSFSKEVDGV